MTRKDYIAISRIIKEQLGDTHLLVPVANTLCSYFKDENPKFNEDLFKAACFNKKVIEMDSLLAHPKSDFANIMGGTLHNIQSAQNMVNVDDILNECECATKRMNEKNAEISKKSCNKNSN